MHGYNACNGSNEKWNRNSKLNKPNKLWLLHDESKVRTGYVNYSVIWSQLIFSPYCWQRSLQRTNPTNQLSITSTSNHHSTRHTMDVAYWYIMPLHASCPTHAPTNFEESAFNKLNIITLDRWMQLSRTSVHRPSLPQWPCESLSLSFVNWIISKLGTVPSFALSSWPTSLSLQLDGSWRLGSRFNHSVAVASYPSL